MEILWLLVAGGCEAPSAPPLAEAPAQPRTCADPLPPGALAYEDLVFEGDGTTEDRRFWGGGIVGGDFDSDGDVDLIVPGPFDAAYLENTDGDFVIDRDMLPRVDYSYAAGGAAADYDADGDLDALITRWGPPDILLRNDGGRLVVSDAISFPPSHSQSAAWGDLDLDGALDLVIAGHGQVEETDGALVIDGPGDPERLFLGDGAGALVDESSRLPQEIHDGYGYVVGITDLDGQGLPDLIVTNDYQSWLPGMSAVSDGTTYTRNDPEVGLTVMGAGMGLAMADVDGDGRDDFVQPLWNQIDYRRSTAAGVWVEASAQSGLTLPERDEAWVGWGAELADLDNDMDLDLVVAFGHLDTIAAYMSRGEVSTENAEGQHLLAFLQQPGGSFALSGPVGLERPGVWRGFVVADFDRNGWLDIARHDIEGPIAVSMARCGENAWIDVAPEPISSAVGAKVIVRAAGLSQTRRITAGGTSLDSGGPPEAHFGLGPHETVDEIEILWPDGARSLSGPFAARQRVTISRDSTR